MQDYAPLAGCARSPGLARAVTLLAETTPKADRRGEPLVRDDAPRTFALQYLDAFGYLKRALADWTDIAPGDITAALKLFQATFGLARTGRLCARTVRAMELPRCGCPDIVRPHHTQYQALQARVKDLLPAWRKRSLTYFVSDYVGGIGKADQDQVIAAAFASWTAQGQVDVQPARSAQGADMILSTGSGPSSNFDGPGGVLAWAYLPDGSDQQLLLRFDLGETWTLGATGAGIALLNVAAHEIGHLFGLSHSRVDSALMAPYYNAAIRAPQPNDDIPRFQARYGARTTPVSPPGVPAPTPTPTPAPTTPPATPAAGAPARIAVEGQALVWLNGQRVA